MVKGKCKFVKGKCKFVKGKCKLGGENVKGKCKKVGLLLVLVSLSLDRGDWSRRDGITVFLFSDGRSLVWDCTCADTFDEVHLNRSAMEAGTATNSAEEHKRRKLAALTEANQFEPIAVEAMGVYGGSTGVILSAIGRRLVETTGQLREANWLRQKPGISEAMRSAISQLVGRGFRGVGESSSTHPLTLFLMEFSLPWEIFIILVLILKFLILSFVEKQSP